MIRRRRRRSREIAFGVDSFLDVIANVIGIIVKMILVVWVGARSYHEIQFKPKVEKAILISPHSKKIEDPLEQEIVKHRLHLQEVQKNLLEQLRKLPPLAEKQKQTEAQLLALAAQRYTLEKGREWVKQAIGQQQQFTWAAHATLSELHKREEKLKQELAKLTQLPFARKTIHYRTPVSRKVETEELFFECRGGRVTFIDIAALVQDMKDELKAKIDVLKDFGKVEGFTRQIGAFRLNFVIQRDKVDGLVGGSELDGKWVVEPLAPFRGETLAQAFQPNSQFRQIVDYVDRKQTVVTFWVYPDSFALFRQLRDYLYQGDIEVAARPLPEGHPIAASRHGSASRSQ